MSAAEIRQLFNDGDFWARSQRGELTQTVMAESHPRPPRASLPTCTRSQIVAYFDAQDVKVALVHQYLLPDGSLGASGRPDPKKLLVNGVLHIVTGTATGTAGGIRLTGAP